MMDAAIKWFHGERAIKTVAKLQKNGFEALFFDKREAAVQEILSRITPDARVGFGGSVTVRELGLVDTLRDRGNTVYDHWQKSLSPEELKEVRRSHLTCDTFITSSNAITMDGKLVNIDHSGNRVAAMIFGPESIIVVAGVNKIVKNVEAGLERIKNYTSPLNTHRRNDPTPCAKLTFCADCAMPHRLCRVTTIIEARPAASKNFTVMIIGENLGY
ncbi:MAG: lactate utilization protein [Desulfocucumaceae bacterium]